MNENLIKYYVENGRLDCLISLFEAQRDNLIRAEILNRSYLAEIARLKTTPNTQSPQELTTFLLAPREITYYGAETKKKPAPKPSPLDLI